MKVGSRLSLALATVLVAMLAATQAAARTSSASCRTPRGQTVVFHSGGAVVTRRRHATQQSLDDTYYACLARVGKEIKIGTASGTNCTCGSGATTERPVGLVVAGDFLGLAWDHYVSAAEDASVTIEEWNLRTGRRSLAGPHFDNVWNLPTLVAGPRGTLAWVVGVTSPLQPITFLLEAFDGKSIQTLASEQAEPQPASASYPPINTVAIAGTTVTWTQDGQPHSGKV